MGRVRRPVDEGIELFNRAQFFEAHEVWEDAWRATGGQEKLLLHGLIQVAAGLHKLQCDQPGGAVSLLSKAAAKLSAIRGGGHGLDPRSLLESVDALKERASRGSGMQTAEPAGFPFPVLPAPRRRLFTARILTHIEIDASASRLWDVLIDFGAYPGWNPFIVRIGGAARRGERIRVEIRPPGRGTMSFRTRVLRVEPHRELRWLGRLPLPGLLEGEHVFSIAPLHTGRVRFSQRETFRGLLVPLLGRALFDATRRGFEEMNRTLKRRLEQANAGPATL